MIIVDATILNAAIPSIIRDLGIGITQAEWANSIYSLVFAALLVSVGRIGDLAGRCRVFVWGLARLPGREPAHRARAVGNRSARRSVLPGVGGALILPSTLSIVLAGLRSSPRHSSSWGSSRRFGYPVAAAR
jgi:MFS family permease